MSTISGRHMEEPSTSTYARHLQVFSIDIDMFWSRSLIFCTFSREKPWKMSLFVGACVFVCIYIYIYVYIYINIWFCIFPTCDCVFFRLFFRDKSMIFRHFHRHLQGTLSTFDIDICRHLNQHLCTTLHSHHKLRPPSPVLSCAQPHGEPRGTYLPSCWLLFQWAADIVYAECVCSECLTECVKKLPPNRQFTEIVCFRSSPAHLHTIPCDPRMRQCAP